MKSGFVSIIGRPNVGKSTLLNSLINEHIAITSDKAGTTRNIIEGIYNAEETQIVFVDTPGVAKPQNKLGTLLNKQSSALTKDVDVILFLADAKSGLGRGDEFILKSLNGSDIPVILVLNKIDMLTKDCILKRILEYKDLYDFKDIVPISALNKDNLEELINTIKKYLKDDCMYYSKDIKTSSSKYFMISEFVREKLLRIFTEEIPHSITCKTTHYEEKKNIIEIVVEIIVDRPSLKKIIIGKNGQVLKQVGMEARKDMEKLLGKKVYLETYVKVEKDWRDKDNFLKANGFKDF